MPATRRFAFLLLSMVCFWQSACHADVTLSLPGGVLQAGGSGTFAVTIQPTTGTELLSLYEVELLITPSAGTPGTTLAFADPQSEDFLTQPNYLFFGDSDVNQGGFAATALFSTNTLRDSISVADFTASFNDVALTTPQLLFEVDLEHLIPVGVNPATLAGDTYTIEATLLTFEDSDFDPVVATASTGLITIVAVPEPATAAWAGFGVAGMVMRRRRRR